MARFMEATPAKRLLCAFLAVVLVISSLGIAGMAYGTDKTDVHPLTETEAVEGGAGGGTDADAGGDGASSGVDSDGENAGSASDSDSTGSGSADADAPSSDGSGTDGDGSDATDPDGSGMPDGGNGDEEANEGEDATDAEEAEVEGGVFIDDVRYDVNEDGTLGLPAIEEGNEKLRLAHDGIVSGNTIYFRDGKKHTMSIPKGETVSSYVRITNGSTLDLDGDGTIDLKGKSGSVIIVEGRNSVLNLNKNSGCLTISGGTGSLVNACGQNNFGSDYVAGGAILVQRNSAISSHTIDRYGNHTCESTATNAALNMYNGIIKNNKAAAGGGIFIDRYCGFTMSGGVVQNNTATKYEGGGIYIAGDRGANDALAGSCAIISGGKILSNTTQTVNSWGGGGIFVESKGVVKLDSSLITDNTAGGLGGGVSGCPHAYIGVGKISDGAAIFGNTANYSGLGGSSGMPRNEYLTCLATKAIDGSSTVYSGDMYAYGYSGNNNPAQKGAWSKDYFAAHYKEVAQDYYCTKSSIVEGSDIGQNSGYAWIGYAAGSYDNSGYKGGANSFGHEIAVAKGNSYTAVDATLALTNTLPKGTRNSFTNNRSVEITNNTSYTHGGGIGCNGKLLIGKLERGEESEPISFDIQKAFQNSLGEELSVGSGQFEFDVFASDANWSKGALSGTFKNDANGHVNFQVASDAFKPADGVKNTTVYFLIQEKDKAEDGVEYDAALYGAKLDLSWTRTQFLLSGQNYVTRYTPSVTSKAFVRISADSSGAQKVESIGSDLTVTNKLNLLVENALSGDKYYYGSLTGEDARFSFTMEGITDPFANSQDQNAAVGSLVRTATDGNEASNVDDGVYRIAVSTKNGDYTDNKASFTFPKIGYAKPGDYHYMISEDSAQDSKVYVAKVGVSVDKRDGADASGGAISLKAELTGLFAARSADSAIVDLEPMDAGSSSIAFHNMDIAEGAMLNGYLVSAASNTALEQRCLVDPKIYKKLVDANGKELTLQPDQFMFQLIQVGDDYNQNGGPVISSTGNDAFGMVDFDKAANVSGDPDNPSCLEYNTAGTYHYRVFEDPVYDRDPSVDYDDTIITFTTVIEYVDGALECTDMYYGHLDENGVNQRYYESENPTWHPTLTNKAKGMDLRVQKTSAADREQGLEGAVYGLWMHNVDDEGDFYMGSAKSGEDGYIYFEDVNLSFGNWYYFLEEEAPDFHTVSRYRSMYFTLANAADGSVTLVYSESPGGDAVDAEGEPVGGFAKASFDAANGGFAKAAAFSMRAKAGARDVANGARDGVGSTLTYAYDNGVYDELTRLNVSKLETNTHEFVEGAELAIIERSSGRVVASWITGAETKVISGQLNVGVQYILREMRVPDGYAKADDVVFSFDAYGNVSVLSGTDGGNAEVIGDSISLYDTLLDVENVSYRARTIGGDMAQTGDDALDVVWMLLVAATGAGALLVGALLLRRRFGSTDKGRE